MKSPSRLWLSLALALCAITYGAHGADASPKTVFKIGSGSGDSATPAGSNDSSGMASASLVTGLSSAGAPSPEELSRAFSSSSAPKQTVAPVAPPSGAFTFSLGDHADSQSSKSLATANSGATDNSVSGAPIASRVKKPDPKDPDSSKVVFAQGANTAGTVRVNDLANFEALCNIMANGFEVIGLAWGSVTIISACMTLSTGSDQGPNQVYKGIMAVVAALMLPGVVNWLVASGRDANIFL